MKSAYYYLISSLPVLNFSVSPGISYEDFLRRAKEQLCGDDMNIIKRARIMPQEIIEDSCVILKEWKEFDITLRNELARMRASKKGKDASDYIRLDEYPNPFFAHYAHLIYNQSSPLEAEKLFDRMRWDKIEDLKLGHFFDITYLVAYALQLQILERWQKVNQEEGMQILEELAGKL